MVLVPDYSHTHKQTNKDNTNPQKTHKTPTQNTQTTQMVRKGTDCSVHTNEDFFLVFLHLFLMYVVVITDQSQITNLSWPVWHYL